MSASLKKSFADVTRRKGRTLMVVLGIFIGVLGLTGVTFIQQTILSAFTYSTGTAANSPDITLQASQLDPELAPQLSAVADVQAVQMQSVFATQWHVSAAPGHVPIAIVSYPDLQDVPITPFQLTSGRYPGIGEIVLEYGDRDLQPVSIGDTITVDTNQTTTLRIVGFARTQGLPSPAGSGTARGYMSEAAMNQAFGAFAPAPGSQGPQLLQEVAVKVQNISQVIRTEDALAQALRAKGLTVLNMIINQPFNQEEITANGVFTLLLMLSVLAVILTALLILNTIITLIAEQTPIIGTLKAMGGTRGAILRGYLLSVVIYGAASTLPAIALGLLLGYPLASSLASAISLAVGPFTVFPWIIILGLAVGFGLPLLSALLPLWMGTRITVREAISAYGISAGAGYARNPLARLTQRLTWVAQTTWLGLRGVFRKRWRTALTLLTLTLAGAAFLVVQTATAATNQTTVNAFAPYHYDVLAEIYAQNAPLMAQISALPNVGSVERYREDEGAESQWGQLRLLGFQPDTTLYTPQLISGRWLSPNDTDAVLLNEEASAATGLHVGDTLTLSRRQCFNSNCQTIPGNRAPWTIIGIIHQPMYDLGTIGMVMTSVENANQFFGDPADLTPELLIEARDRSPSAVDALTRQIDQLINGGNTNGGQVQISGGQVETIQQEVQFRQQSWLIFYVLLYSVALIVGAVGILGLADALAASVLERRREIGLLRAMGATDWRVARVFWVEGMALGGIAWLLGMLLGLPLAYGFIQVMSKLVFRVDFIIAPSAFVVMLAAVLIISTLASIIPALQASHVRIADMLRYE